MVLTLKNFRHALRIQIRPSHFIFICGIGHCIFIVENTDAFHPQPMQQRANYFIKQAVLFRISKFYPSGCHRNRQREAVEYLLAQILCQKQGIIFLTIQERACCGASDEQ